MRRAMRFAGAAVLAAAVVAGAGCAGTKRAPTGPGAGTGSGTGSGTGGTGTGTGTVSKPVVDDVGAPAQEMRTQLPKENHVVEILVPGGIVAGQRAVIRIRVRPTGEMAVIPEAPNALTITAPPDVVVEKPEQKRTDAVVATRESIEFEVAFTAAHPGELAFTGELRSHTCSDTICNSYKDALAFTVPVR